MERIKTTWIPKPQQLVVQPTFIQSFIKSPFVTLLMITRLADKFQKKNIIEYPVYNQCKKIYIKNAQWCFYNTLIIGISTAIGTKILHQFRAFALSAPNRKRTFFFKYLMVPPIIAKINYEMSMKKQKLFILENMKQSDQFKLQYRLFVWSVEKDRSVKTQLKLTQQQFQRAHGRKPHPHQIE